MPPVLRSTFFFNDTATTEIYTLSLHDALPTWPASSPHDPRRVDRPAHGRTLAAGRGDRCRRDHRCQAGDHDDPLSSWCAPSFLLLATDGRMPRQPPIVDVTSIRRESACPPG